MFSHVNHCSSIYYYEQGAGLKSQGLSFYDFCNYDNSQQKLISLQIDYFALNHATYTPLLTILHKLRSTKSISRVVFRPWPTLKTYT